MERARTDGIVEQVEERGVGNEQQEKNLIPFPHLQLHHPPGVTDFPDPRTRGRSRPVSPSPTLPLSPSSSLPYTELHATSAYSFLRGASLPEHLVTDAIALGLPGLALCDRNGLYGIPRYSVAAREAAAEKKGTVAPYVGCELTMTDGSDPPASSCENATGYRNLCTLLSRGHLRCAEGPICAGWEELPGHVEGLVALTGDDEGPLLRSAEPERELAKIVAAFGEKNVFVELQRHRLRGENRPFRRLVQLAREHRLPTPRHQWRALREQTRPRRRRYVHLPAAPHASRRRRPAAPARTASAA